jgi:hypothetical protein
MTEIDSKDVSSPTVTEEAARASASPGTPDPKSDPRMAQFYQIARMAGVVFISGMVMSILLSLIFYSFWGFYHFIGALLGSLTVTADFFIFKVFAKNARPGPLAKPLWHTVVKFYVISAANILVCFLVIKFGLGHPLSFVAGLGVFIPSTLVGVVFHVVTGGSARWA